MSRASTRQLEAEVPKRLAALLALPQSDMKVERETPEVQGRHGQADLIARIGGYVFVVECKGKGEAAAVAMAAQQVRAFAEQLKKGAIPVVAVPFMGEVGRKLCDEAGVSWLDLSGNAHLSGPPGLRVHIEGKPNLFKRPGRPRSVFAPKSARISRLLLIEPERSFAQRELARAAGMDEGFTSRIVRHLEAERLVERLESGEVKVTDFEVLLEAWREAYDFSKHHIVRGHVAARSGVDVLRQLAAEFDRAKVQYAATGLAGAWLINPFAGFRLVALYVGEMPSEQVRQAIGFREEQAGENVWLVVPNDEGVFQGAEERDGIRCAHPVQVYLDLKRHPERSAEAADELRQKHLRKGVHA